MLKSIALILVVAVAALLLYAATRPDTFAVQRSALIQARADKLFPLINDLRQGNGYGLRDNLRSWPLLCLDELGGERDLNGFSAENLCTVLAGRENKWTIITSNKEFAELHKLDARISSRLVRGQNICVEVKTQDYWTRPEVNAQKPK